MKKNSNYTFDLKTNTIKLSRNFENLLNSGDEEAHIIYFNLCNDFPRMTIAFKPISVRKSKTQITYHKMLLYINCFRESERYLAEFNVRREASKAQPSPYNFVRDWFLETFPSYKQVTHDFDENGKIIMSKDEVQERRQEKEAS